jgi:hypothetical protein
MNCDACKKIETSKRGASGHPSLVEIRKSKANVVGQNIWLIDYACSDCGAKWRYEDDKNDQHAGWSMLSN